VQSPPFQCTLCLPHVCGPLNPPYGNPTAHPLPSQCRWKVAIVQSPPIQSVLRNRIRAGMARFSRTMREEWEAGAHHTRRAGAAETAR
jgi:hypothetical protein